MQAPTHTVPVSLFELHDGHEISEAAPHVAQELAGAPDYPALLHKNAKERAESRKSRTLSHGPADRFVCIHQQTDMLGKAVQLLWWFCSNIWSAASLQIIRALPATCSTLLYRIPSAIRQYDCTYIRSIRVRVALLTTRYICRTTVVVGRVTGQTKVLSHRCTALLCYLCMLYTIVAVASDC